MKHVWMSTILLAAFVSSAGACETCRPRVRAAVYGEGFRRELATLLLPLGIIVAVVGGAYLREESRR